MSQRLNEFSGLSDAPVLHFSWRLFAPMLAEILASGGQAGIHLANISSIFFTRPAGGSDFQAVGFSDPERVFVG